MLCKSPRLGWLSRGLALTLLLSVLSAATASAQIRIIEPTFAPVSDSLPAPAIVAPNQAQNGVELAVQEGRALEDASRWGEALSHYEQALKQFPQDAQLRDRHDLAKIHYDLGRRYQDVSYRKSLITMREHEALELYGEVLAKIDSHYVHPTDWRQLSARSLRCLEIALDDAEFRQRNLRDVSNERIDAYKQAARRAVGSTMVRNRTDARNLAASVAQMGQRHLGLTPTAVVLEFACGAIGGLDNYSAYLTSGQLTDVYSQIDGNFVGLGIELKADEGSLLLVNVIPGSPAERAGMKPKDRILAVDGHSTQDMTTDSAASVLQGVEGSVAAVTVASPGREPRVLKVRREHVEVPSVDQVKMVDADRGVAYLRLVSFQRTTNRDMDRALWSLHRQGMKSLIIDLRGNPGGLLNAAVEVADKFLDRGVIVSTKGRNASEDYRYTAHQLATWQVPLVVLIDGESASASEIFAAAIRDTRRGTIVGQRSYGKGSVQGIFPLAVGGAGVRLTTAKFYSPTGAPIADVGVTPDVQVHMAAKPVGGQPADDEEDLVMKAALQVVHRQFAQR